MNMRVKKVLGTMVLMAVLVLVACPSVFASTSVDIYCGSTLQDSFTASELNAFLPEDKVSYQQYSSYKCSGDFIPDYHATGTKLLPVLLAAIAAYDPDTTITDESSLLAAYSKIEFKDTVSPAYTSGQVNLYNVLYGGRYLTKNDDNPVELVPAILATSDDPNPIRNFHGQQSAKHKVAEEWVKDCDTIILSN